jgi:hypothetical protein
MKLLPVKPQAKSQLTQVHKLWLDLAPQPRGHWEGSFLHTSSATNESYFLRAAIGMAGEAFEGEGRLSLNAKDGRLVEVDLSGAVEGREVSFTVWIKTDKRPEPFTCTATLDPRTNLMRGTWKHPCYKVGHGNCSCEGGGGIFELRRIKE